MDRPKRKRDRLRQFLGLSSRNTSPAPQLNHAQPSPSVTPQTLSRAATPQHVNETPLPPIADCSGRETGVDAPAGALSSVPVSSHAPLDDLAPITKPPNPQSDPATQPQPTELSSEKTKSVAWSGLKTLLKVVESSSDAFGPLKSAVGGQNQCINIFERAAKGEKDYEELQNKLDLLAEDLADFLHNDTNIRMTRSMNNLSTAIDRELELVRKKSARGVIEKHAEALEDESEIMECYRRIQGYLERLKLNANLSVWSAVSTLEAGQRDARLHQLFPTKSAIYNSSKAGDVQRGECTLDTRVAEIAKLMAWAKNPKGENIYWMNGMAGTGKTTIAYSVCTQLEKDGVLAASFFCSRQLADCRDVTAIIPAIAYQLARFSDPFQHALSKVLTTDPDAHTRTMKIQFKSLLVDPLLEVQHAMPVDFVVVIDALDECENENSVGQILELLLSHMTGFELPIRFLLSSRPEPVIYSRLMGQLGHDLDARLVLHEIDQDTVQNDIRKYLQQELRDVPLTPDQLEALARRSGVLFIYASTAARYIKAGLLIMEHEERLNTILGSATGDGEKHDREIDSLYTSILRAALQQPALDESVQTRMKKILDTVICAQEPMTTGGLAGLLRLKNAQQVNAFLRPLSSVVNVTGADGYVTTLHASFPDYMLDKKRSTTFHCYPGLNHTLLAQACFCALETNNIQFNVCSLPSSYLRDSAVAEIKGNLERSVSPELCYACKYWVSHLALGNSQGLGNQLLEFMSRRLLLWMEVLNTKQCINLGPKIMQRAESWSRTNDCSKETIDLAHDAWRFVTMFASHAVSQSTPHIYISMLPFWPKLAPVSVCYKEQAQEAIKVQGSALLRRQLGLLVTWSFDGAVSCICVSSDDALIALGVGSSAYLVDVGTGKKVLGPLDHDGTVRSVALSPDGMLLVSGSEDKTMQLWSTSTGKAVVDPMTKHTDKITSVCFTPDGTRIVSGSNDKTIRVWDWRANKVFDPFKGHGDWVRSACVSPDGARILSGSDDRSVRIWNIESGQAVPEPLVGHTDYVTSVCFSPNGSRIVSGSDDKTIRIWCTQTGQQLAKPFEGHTSSVTSVAFSPDGKQIVSGSWDNTIRLWNTDGTSESVQLLDGHTDFVNSVAFSSDATRILSCSYDNTVRVWDARSKAVIDSPLEAHTQRVSSVCFSHDGTRILSASSDATVRVWDARSGSPLLEPLTGHSNQNNCARFSPDGTHIAAGSADHSIQLWDSETGQPTGEPLAGHSGNVTTLCFSPDGALIASGSYDKTIRVWSTQTGEMTIDPLRGHTNWVWSACFSPDSTRVVSGSSDDTIRVWDVTTGQLVLGPLKEHTDSVWSVCFSPDGARIASASRDTTIRLWDGGTGKGMRDPLKGHTDGILSVCFSPTGDLIASGSKDKTIRLWDADAGVAIGVLLTGHTADVWSVAFSPDGSQIVSGSQDATIQVFDVSDLATLRSKDTSSPPSDGDPDSLKFACQPWVLQEDGWVVDAQSRLLAWVPPDLHGRLIRPRCTLLISASGSFKIELDHHKLGEGWTGCYKP